ncbi:MAG: hypothetical protein QM736_05025 [Vicinamibacterales bacterium]
MCLTAALVSLLFWFAPQGNNASIGRLLPRRAREPRVDGALPRLRSVGVLPRTVLRGGRLRALS